MHKRLNVLFRTALTRYLGQGATVVCAIAGGCRPAADPSEAAAVHVPADTVVTTQDNVVLRIQTLAAGLEVPWDLDFAPDGRVFVTERVGRIRVVDNGVLRPEPWATLEVFGEDDALRPESGLMGIALAPDFEATREVYVMATQWRHTSRLRRAFERVKSRATGAQNSRWISRVYVLGDENGKGTAARVLIDNLPASYYHAGGALRFGPDGMLYVTVGDNLASPAAQDPAQLIGKVLRYRRDGGIPDDNPAAGSAVYASGVRNVQGLAWEPASGALFATDHGPSFLPHEGGRSAHDELNVLIPGGNYGWPEDAGRVAGSPHRSPLVDWTDPLAPAGLVFYTDSLLPWRNSLIVTGLRGQTLRRIVVSHEANEDEWEVQREEPVLTQVFGRVRGIRVAPDGSLYVTTSNRDGRGLPRETDDRILRLLPDSTSSN